MNNRQQIVKLLLLAVLIYGCWVLSKSLWGLYRAQGRVADAETELARVEAENVELESRWNEVNSDVFREKEVRDKLSKQLPGETVVIVPEIEVGVRAVGDSEPRSSSNLEKWRKLFFGKN